ncbi:Excisionase family DNA binding domain-containing protein [Flavobacterium daejeonense]|nr:Excisionase family DNA binding domain-containing protein [Flavobacterium daejeonense]
MAKMMFTTIELPELKKIVEDAILNQLKNFVPVVEQKNSQLLTRKQTAEMLCISLPTLHDWTKTGLIKAHRIGNRVLYKFDEINNSLRQINTSTMKGGRHGN